LIFSSDGGSDTPWGAARLLWNHFTLFALVPGLRNGMDAAITEVFVVIVGAAAKPLPGKSGSLVNLA
jgi:hypothetical protein